MHNSFIAVSFRPFNAPNLSIWRSHSMNLSVFPGFSRPEYFVRLFIKLVVSITVVSAVKPLRSSMKPRRISPFASSAAVRAFVASSFSFLSALSDSNTCACTISPSAFSWSNPKVANLSKGTVETSWIFKISVSLSPAVSASPLSFVAKLTSKFTHNVAIVYAFSGGPRWGLFTES